MKSKNNPVEEIYKSLTDLTKEKSAREKSVSYVGDLLTYPSNRIKEKAIWLIGELGLKYPAEVVPFVNELAMLLSDEKPKIRERAVGALGRIGRADHKLVLPHLDKMAALSKDPMPNVRMNFIWACENIATNAPLLFESKMAIFVTLLDDTSDRVRIEAPEIFRVIGKRKPGLVIPYILKLEQLAKQDSNVVVRIHSLGVIKAIINQI